MPFQFVHLESWSRKPDEHGRGTDFVFDEASRKHGACVHVTAPKPPVTIYGIGIDEVRVMHDEAVAVALTPGARGKLRKIASTQKTLHTVVASHPYTVEEVLADKMKAAEVKDWERRTIAWLKSQYGSSLKSVIRHIDERHWHLHAYVLPTSDPEMRAGIFHPGAVAKKAVKASGARDGEDGKAFNKKADAAYKAAMRQWQDSYHAAVAAPCGMTRLGPGRRRLTREQWKAEQAQAAALKNALYRAETVKRQGQAYIDRTKAIASKIRAEAAKVRETAARFVGIGGAVRAVLDGLRVSRIRDQIRRDFASGLEHAKAAAAKARETAEREREARRIAEKQVSDARYTARQATARAASAQLEVRRLSSALSAAMHEPEPKLGMTP